MVFGVREFNANKRGANKPKAFKVGDATVWHIVRRQQTLDVDKRARRKQRNELVARQQRRIGAARRWRGNVEGATQRRVSLLQRHVVVLCCESDERKRDACTAAHRARRA